MIRTIRKASSEDISEILYLIDCGRQKMRNDGNYTQWPEGYPSQSTIQQDIDLGNCYLVCQDTIPVATFAFIKGPDVTYNRIYRGNWLDDQQPYYVVHRLASLPQIKGVFKDVMNYCFQQTGNVRIDTHEDNHIMQHLINAYGFTYCGIIYLLNGEERLAYQRLSNDVSQNK